MNFYISMINFQTSVEDDLFSWKPTYDTYGFGVTLSHICCGYRGIDFDNKVSILFVNDITNN